jgi:hypothetical protein
MRLSAAHERAKALQVLGRHDEAVLDFNDVLDSQPAAPNALFRRGISHKALRDFAKAADDIETAKQLTTRAEDRAILHGIAQWWKVNGESIHATQRTPLPPQSWGESTLKGEKLYLHVFEWPSDGKLLVGGLNGDVSRAALLAAPQSPLAFERIGPDLQITLPGTAPDAADSVIVLDCPARPRGDSAQLLQTNTANKLSIFTAELLGPVDRKGWSLGKGTSITSHAKGWKHKDCAVRWNTRLTKPRRFQATLHYDAPEAINAKIETDGGAIAAKTQHTYGGTFTVTIGSQKLRGEIHQHGMNVAVDLGPIDLEPGDLEITIQADEITGKELMLLKSLTLTPVISK